MKAGAKPTKAVQRDVLFTMRVLNIIFDADPAIVSPEMHEPLKVLFGLSKDSPIGAAFAFLKTNVFDEDAVREETAVLELPGMVFSTEKASKKKAVAAEPTPIAEPVQKAAAKPRAKKAAAAKEPEPETETETTEVDAEVVVKAPPKPRAKKSVAAKVESVEEPETAPVEKVAKAPAKPRAKPAKTVALESTAAFECKPDLSGELKVTEELTYNLIEIDPDETLTDVNTGDMLKIPEGGEHEMKVVIENGKIIGYKDLDTGNTYAV